MTNNELNALSLALGKAQMVGMFQRQEVHALDDSEFLLLLETVLTAFETTGIEKDVTEQIWEYAFAVYDRACHEADPSWTSAENRGLMQRYLLGPRGLKPKARRSRRR